MLHDVLHIFTWQGFGNPTTRCNNPMPASLLATKNPFGSSPRQEGELIHRMGWLAIATWLRLSFLMAGPQKAHKGWHYQAIWRFFSDSSLTNWGYLNMLSILSSLTSLEKNPKKFIVPTWNLSRLRTWQATGDQGVQGQQCPNLLMKNAWLLKFLVCWRTWTMGFWGLLVVPVESVGLGDAADFFLCLGKSRWYVMDWSCMRCFFVYGIST